MGVGDFGVSKYSHPYNLYRVYLIAQIGEWGIQTLE